MKTLLSVLLLLSLCIADYVQIPPYTDPNGSGYTNEEEYPWEFEVIDANNCLCGGESTTINVYYLVTDENADGYGRIGSGGQPIYNQNYVNWLPCVDMSNLSLTWKRYEYDSNWNMIDANGYVTADYYIWGLSESYEISDPSQCSSEDWSEVIKHFDKVEYNQQTKILKLQKQNDNKEKINSKLFDIKSKIAVSNNELSSMGNLITTPQLDGINLNKTNDNTLLDEILNKITQNFDYTSDMNSNEVNKQNIENALNTLQLEDYTNDDSSIQNDFTIMFQTDITNSYNTYLSSLGIGGYASAPEPIIINLYGNTYKFLDVDTFSDDVLTLRATFLSFGYLWGFIIALRGV